MGDPGLPSMVTASQRVSNEPGYVLHTRPWKETSLVLELFTRGHGRMVAVAKGARRPHSQLRPLLLPFQPVLVTWSGRSEVRLVHSVEWQGGVPQLGGKALLCAFYLNELLMAALVREDPHDRLFDAYDGVIRELAGGAALSAILRRFEIVLLRELGFGLELETEAETGAPVEADRLYRYSPERGAMALAAEREPDAWTVRGRTLLDMAQGEYADPQTGAESKRLMRGLLSHHLGNPELRSRELVV